MSKRSINKRLDTLIEEIVRRRCSGLAIDVLEIGNVYQAGYNAAFNGEDIEAAVVAKYHQLAVQVRS